MDCLSTINDVELNEHCLKAKQMSEQFAMLQREGKWDLLWVALSQAKDEAEKGMFRLMVLK